MKYRLVYCDPPYFYNDRKLVRNDGSSSRFGFGAVNHYPVMSNNDLYKLDMRLLSDRGGCILAMWCTSPNLPFGLELMEGWGFEYSTIGFVWIKTNKNTGMPFFGTGSYTGSNIEYVLFGRAGERNPERVHKDVPQVVMAPHPRDVDGKIIHSGKPIVFRDMLDRLYGDIPKIELFARTEVGPIGEGWDATGYDLDGMDIRDAIPHFAGLTR